MPEVLKRVEHCGEEEAPRILRMLGVKARNVGIVRDMPPEWRGRKVLVHDINTDATYRTSVKGSGSVKSLPRHLTDHEVLITLLEENPGLPCLNHH